MKRTQILISEEQHKLLKDISSKKNISMAEAVRECITYYEKNKPIISEEKKHEKVLGMAGKYNSGLGDLAKNHDKYIEEDLDK